MDVYRPHCIMQCSCCLLTARDGRSGLARQQAAQQGMPLTPESSHVSNVTLVCRLPPPRPATPAAQAAVGDEHIVSSWRRRHADPAGELAECWAGSAGRPDATQRISSSSRACMGAASCRGWLWALTCARISVPAFPAACCRLSSLVLSESALR